MGWSQPQGLPFQCQQVFLKAVLVTFTWKLHSFDVQLLDPRNQLNSQCWLLWANKICGQESSLYCATAPVTCQMAPVLQQSSLNLFGFGKYFFNSNPSEPNQILAGRIKFKLASVLETKVMPFTFKKKKGK